MSNSPLKHKLTAICLKADKMDLPVFYEEKRADLIIPIE
jgi:hypothetical protein